MENKNLGTENGQEKKSFFKKVKEGTSKAWHGKPGKIIRGTAYVVACAAASFGGIAAGTEYCLWRTDKYNENKRQQKVIPAHQEIPFEENKTTE